MTPVTTQPGDEFARLIQNAHKETKRLREQTRRTVQAYAALDDFLARFGVRAVPHDLHQEA